MLIVYFSFFKLQANINPKKYRDGEPHKLSDKDAITMMDNGCKDTFLYVVDEISLVSPKFLCDFEERCKFMKSPESGGRDVDNQPFGGCHILLIGDFGQLPPVQAESLFGASMDFALNKTDMTSIGAQKSLAGCKLFNGFQFIQFDKEDQRRSVDKVHTDILTKLHDFNNTYPVDDGVIKYLLNFHWSDRVISNKSNEVLRDWLLNGRIAVTTKIEKAKLLVDHVSRLGLALNRPIFRWRHTLKHVSSWSNEVMDKVYENNPEFYGYFIEGANAVVLSNIIALRGINNGTRVIYRSFVFTNDAGEQIGLEEPTDGFIPGVVYDIDEPSCIIVELLDTDETHKKWVNVWPKEDNISPTPDESVYIPIFTKEDKRCLIYFKNVRPANGIYKRFVVELDYIASVYKLQGCTVAKLLLLLNKRNSSKLKSLTLFT